MLLPEGVAANDRVRPDAVSHPRPSGARKRTPARCIFRRGLVTEIGRKSPLQKMTSAASGIGRDSVSEALAERCQVSAFFVPTAQASRLPGEESRTRHAPSEGGRWFALAGWPHFNPKQS